jgi:hypothetical protein
MLQSVIIFYGSGLPRPFASIEYRNPLYFDTIVMRLYRRMRFGAFGLGGWQMGTFALQVVQTLLFLLGRQIHGLSKQHLINAQLATQSHAQIFEDLRILVLTS